jgi:hypothetical protein
MGINASKALIIFLQLITLGFLLLIAYYFLAIKASIAFYGVCSLLILPLLIQNCISFFGLNKLNNSNGQA